MPSTIWTDRSRIETYQRCPRLRWYEYHQDGIGITPAKKPLPLCVGGSVHVGLQWLLMGQTEDHAAAAAVNDFSQHKSAIQVDLAEQTAMASSSNVLVMDFDAQVRAQARELGLDESDPLLRELFANQRDRAAEWESWLYHEQAALVEGLVRAYARRRLPALLAEYEVVEVEREGDWELSRSLQRDTDSPSGYTGYMLRFMSRPDAVLRSRKDHNLYLQSYKTAATWDVRKARDAEHDMQGLSEAIDVERRLGERVMGIRYEYMLKGPRYEDKDLSSRMGMKAWAQRSHLVRAYQGPDSAWCWSYDFLKDDGSSSKLYYKNWRPRAVWESMSIRQWVDMLDTTMETMSAYDSTIGQEPRLLGYKSEAQAQGYTTTHPLDDLFPAPLMVYRSDDQARDWVEQIEEQERQVATKVSLVNNVINNPDENPAEVRHLLNLYFPMTRRACSYPSECPFTKVCYGGEDIQSRPLDSGLYKPRKPNHPQEEGEGEKGG